MTTSRERILEMVASRQITAEEGDKLLAAIEERRSSRWRLLVDPFDRLGSTAGLVVAVGVALASIALTTMRVRFDGALDLHVVAEPVSFAQGLVDQGAAWIVPALVLWLGALVIGRQGRAIDFFVGVGVARLPMLLGGIVAAPILADAARLMKQAEAQQFTPEIIAAVAVVLPCIAWYVAILYYAFKTASGLKGPRLAIGFICSLVSAEVLSKVLVYTVRV